MEQPAFASGAVEASTSRAEGRVVRYRLLPLFRHASFLQIIVRQRVVEFSVSLRGNDLKRR